MYRYVCVYIYIYREREREKELILLVRERAVNEQNNGGSLGIGNVLVLFFMDCYTGVHFRTPCSTINLRLCQILCGSYIS